MNSGQLLCNSRGIASRPSAKQLQHTEQQQTGKTFSSLPCLSYLQLYQRLFICPKYLFLCHLKAQDVLQVAQLPWRYL